HHDQREHAVTPKPKPGEKFRYFLRRLRDGEKISKEEGADQHRENGSGRARSLQERTQDLILLQAPAQHPDNESATGAHAARFRRREEPAIKTADHKEKKQQWRPDVPD